MAQPFSDLVLALPNLRFAYPLDAAGTADAGPNNLTLTANNTPGTDSPGPVLDDDGTSFNGSDESMSRAHDAAFDFGTNDITLGCFIKPSSVAAGSARFFLCHDGDGGSGSWEMFQTDTGTALSSRVEGVTVTATGVLDTSWQFVALVLDRDGNGRWWRNGDWAAAGTSIASVSGNSIDATATLWIGRRETSGYFTGSIAWAWGCASALTNTQLLALYDARDDATSAAVAKPGALSALTSLRALVR